MNAVWTALVFYLFKFSFKDYVQGLLEGEDYFSIFERKARREPLKVSFVVRFLYIPQIYKNFFLCLFDLSFRDFYLPALAQYFPYLTLPLFIGSNLKSLTDFYHRGRIPNAKVYYSVMLFSLFFLVSLVLVGYLGWFAYSELLRMKREQKQELADTHKAGPLKTELAVDDDAVSRAESSKILRMDN